MKSLIDGEKERRSKGFFKSNISKLKSNLGKKFEEIKTEAKEKKRFGKELKSIEKRSYRSALKVEAAKQGRRKARRSYGKRNSNVAKRVMNNLKTKGNPGFMELPGSNNKKKGDDAFNFF